MVSTGEGKYVVVQFGELIARRERGRSEYRVLVPHPLQHLPLVDLLGAVEGDDEARRIGQAHQAVHVVTDQD
jgi:hypothetical protein